MTRHRRRHAQSPTSPYAIPKPHDKASYPSPSERSRILACREELIKALINLRVQGNLDEARVNDLIAEYGPDEVFHVSLVLQTKFQHSGFLVDEPQIYRHYRLGFARFGGKRRFLLQPEQEELNFERAMMYAQREFKSLLPLEPSPRENELQELLIMDWHFWEDITPLDIPPRPAEYPPPAAYPSPLDTILTWGWDLDPGRISREHSAWTAYQPDLEHIVFDKTLLNGWPGEPASWAPWHALHLLGVLHAFNSARHLADLYILPNDWLSDCLPKVWAQMGAPVENVLWGILDDPKCKPEQRGLASSGLQKLIENKSIPRLPAIHSLAERLSPGGTDNAIVNAYIIFVLENLNAVEAKSAIRAAFKKKLVDTKIMNESGISFLNNKA